MKQGPGVGGQNLPPLDNDKDSGDEDEDDEPLSPGDKEDTNSSDIQQPSSVKAEQNHLSNNHTPIPQHSPLDITSNNNIPSQPLVPHQPLHTSMINNNNTSSPPSNEHQQLPTSTFSHDPSMYSAMSAYAMNAGHSYMAPYANWYTHQSNQSHGQSQIIT